MLVYFDSVVVEVFFFGASLPLQPTKFAVTIKASNRPTIPIRDIFEAPAKCWEIKACDCNAAKNGMQVFLW